MESDKLRLFEQLEPKEQRAIELRYRGENYVVISKDLGMNRGTINEWFLPGGKLYEAWQEYKTVMAVERTHQLTSVVNELYRVAVEAINVIEMLMLKKSEETNLTKAQVDQDRNRLLAAQDVLDRTIGKIEKLDINAKVGVVSLGQLSYEELKEEAIKHGIDVNKIIAESDITSASI